MKPVVFVQPSSVAGWASDNVVTEPRLGRHEQTCDACGSPWGPTRCSSARCNSIESTTRYIESVPFMTGLTELIKPKKILRATAAQTKALRSLQTAVTGLLVELRVLDAQLRDAVRGDVDELREAQAIVHTALSISGDASPDRVAGLSLSLTAIAASLNLAIEHLEATPK